MFTSDSVAVTNFAVQRPPDESLIRTWSPLVNHRPKYRNLSPSAYMSLSASERDVLLQLSRIGGPEMVFILGDKDEDNVATAMIYSITQQCVAYLNS